jgi:hypothetical protein
LGPKCIDLDNPRILSHVPSCPPRAQLTETPSHFPLLSPVLPCCARSSSFLSSAPPRPPLVSACRPDS